MTRLIALRDALFNRILRKLEGGLDLRIVTADFGAPAFDDIRARFPDNVINVGIAEQNLINVSVGLALEGEVVFTYAIAPFITMRAFEQVRTSVSMLSLERQMNITLIGVGTGLSYDVAGPTHQCLEDVQLMRMLPNMRYFPLATPG